MTTKEQTTQATSPGEEQQAHRTPSMPRLPIPGMSGMPSMPTGTAGRALWWGGLAALAAFDIVEWPVALVVGTGSWVAEQFAKAAAEGQRAEQGLAAQHMPPQRTNPPA